VALRPIVYNGIAATTGTETHRRPDRRAVRHLDVLRFRLANALQTSGRFEVRRNVVVRLSDDAIGLVRRSKGAYIGISLPRHSQSSVCTSLDLLVIDERENWAGGFVVSHECARSPRAMRRLERDIRAVELVLRAHVRNSGWKSVDTVTVGIIDGGHPSSDANDLVIFVNELEERLGVSLVDFP